MAHLLYVLMKSGQIEILFSGFLSCEMDNYKRHNCDVIKTTILNEYVLSRNFLILLSEKVNEWFSHSSHKILLHYNQLIQWFVII